MADDTASLLEVMGIASAHVVGASMGGFIAQTVALRHPDRVRSLSLLMTSTGSRLVGRPRLRMAGRLLRRRPAVDRESAVEGVVGALRLIASPGYGFEEARLRDVAGRSYDRAYDPAGYFRQLAAVSAQSDRTRSLRRVAVPTVVLHGLADPLVSVSGGRAIARAMQGARFVGFPGMGHDLPRPLWPRFAAEISAVATRGEAQRSGNR
jgi:pimeloyl-ACP methyl ester carboxylesterase